MDIEISYGNDSLHLEVENPHKMNSAKVAQQITDFLQKKGIDKANIEVLSLVELLPKMVRGVAGCESGCPANAYSLVRSGFLKYKLEYIDGGILTANHGVHNGKGMITIKVFPDF